MSSISAGRRDVRMICDLIRQEAHELAATRQARAKKYKLETTKKDLERKEARYKAIKDGEKMLHKMRDRLTDVVGKSRNDILVRALIRMFVLANFCSRQI